MSTVGKSSKDFPLPIFPALMASTKRDASCARQDPFSVWVCERHFRSDKQLPRYWCVPSSLFRVNCRGAASSTSSIRSPMMSAATSAWRSPDSHRGIQCWYTRSLRFEPSVELVGEPAHKNNFSYLGPVALYGTFETNRVVLQKYLMVKWWMFNYSLLLCEPTHKYAFHHCPDLLTIEGTLGNQRFELEGKSVKSVCYKLITAFWVFVRVQSTWRICYLFISKGGEEVLKFVSAVSLGETNYFVDFSSHDSPALRMNRKMVTM